MCLHELSNHVAKCSRFIRFWHDMHRQDLRQNWLRSAKLDEECNFNWSHSPCKSLCWCLYLGRKCVSFQLKYRHHPTPIAPTWTCLLRNSRGNRQFFRTFSGGISCDSSSLTSMTCNVVMRAYFKIGALYSGSPVFNELDKTFLWNFEFFKSEYYW